MPSKEEKNTAKDDKRGEELKTAIITLGLTWHPLGMIMLVGPHVEPTLTLTPNSSNKSSNVYIPTYTFQRIHSNVYIPTDTFQWLHLHQ